jgi:predicted Holliday junction resolvase-like endonuclease
MNSAKEAEEIIRTLTANRFYAECQCCGESILLKEAGLFYLDDFTPEAEELYQCQLEGLKEEQKELRERRKSIPQISESRAKAVNIGFILERIAPSMKEFQFDRNDCRSLFDPIDYIIFEGLSMRGSVSKILFVEIKTGGARLTDKQREIREVIDHKHVLWDTYVKGVK